MSAITSVLSILLIALDRLFAVLKPFAYKLKARMNVARVIVALGWIWVISISSVAVLHFGLNAKRIIPLYKAIPVGLQQLLRMTTLIPIIAIAISYVVIIMKVYKQRKVVSTIVVCSAAPALYGNSTQKHSKRITKMAIIIVGAVILCRIPCIIYQQFVGANGKTVYRVFHLLMVSNSFMNPVIYCWQNRDFRAAFFVLLGRYKKNYNENMLWTVRTK